MSTARGHHPRWRYVVTAVLALATLLWTGAAAAGWFAGWDQAWRARPLEPLSPTAQIWAGIAVVFHPIVTYCALVVTAVWATRRRLRNLGLACVLVIPVAWGLEALLKRLLREPRPVAPTNMLITAGGWSYPSGHVVAAATVASMLTAVVVTTRQRRGTVLLTGTLAVAFVVLIAVDRWVLSAHWVADLVGSLFVAGFAVAAVLLACRVHYLTNPWHTVATPADGAAVRRAAVVYNPAKVGDLVTFRQHIEYELRSRGWAHPDYYETTVDDPGRDATQRALAKGYDLLLASGGDGTVREVCSTVAGTGLAVGLIPAGTTNLLARNLGVSLDEAAAIRTALDGVRSRIDLVRIVPDDDESRATHLDVMGGVGIDAAMFAHTDAELKAKIGYAAYGVAAARQWQEQPATFTARMQLDDDDPTRIEASTITVGNVGSLQGGIQLLPGARPDDGLLNVAVFSQATASEWLRAAGDLVGGRPVAGAEEHTAARVRFEFDAAHPFELDGDVLGDCRTLAATVEPGALTIMLPRQDGAG